MEERTRERDGLHREAGQLQDRIETMQDIFDQVEQALTQFRTDI